MKIILSCFLAASVFCGQAAAEEISSSEATRFITTFYQAMQKHDLATITTMIDKHANINVLWLQANPAQSFTFSKADYLQQLKATWRFASNDHYEIKNLRANLVNGSTVLSLTVNENRILFGKKAGQKHDLKISIKGDNTNLRIVAINSKTEFW